ncbi:Dihydroorotase [Fusarium oxysporum f. sp. albedinis]|nr:Dihydroorotase [Fusarium oxysporum f. sp. albedinis]
MPSCSQRLVLTDHHYRLPRGAGKLQTLRKGIKVYSSKNPEDYDGLHKSYLPPLTSLTHGYPSASPSSLNLKHAACCRGSLFALNLFYFMA